MTGISDDLIRHRSYEIWLRDGCPDGQAVQHWLEAEAELEADRYVLQLASVDFDCCMMVLPRPRISQFPQRRLADRISARSAT